MNSIKTINEHEYDNILMQEVNKIIESPSYKPDKTHILNLNATHMSILEKFVYDIGIDELNMNKINIKDNICIEFWVKSKISYDKQTHTSHGLYDFHIDKDEELYTKERKYVTPILSNITYLNRCHMPLLVTDINTTRYKYKEFNNSDNVYMIFPEKNKSITIDPRLYHGVIDPLHVSTLDNVPRYIIAINIWKDHIPCDVNMYNCTSDKLYNKDPVFSFKHGCVDNDTCTILNNDIFNYDFFNELLYNSTLLFPPSIIDQIKCNMSNNITNFKIHKSDNVTLRNSDISFIHELPEITHEIHHIQECINNNTPININTRFIQRFIYNSIFTRESCKWLVNEAETYANINGWMTTRHTNHPTVDLPIDNIKSIFNFIIIHMQPILDRVKQSYNLDTDTKFNIVDSFIVKYDKNGGQVGLEKHLDGCFLTINIPLNDPNEYSGGGIIFNDGIRYINNNIGDAIIHSGQVYHSGMNITDGVRYSLISFINIEL